MLIRQRMQSHKTHLRLRDELSTLYGIPQLLGISVELFPDQGIWCDELANTGTGPLVRLNAICVGPTAAHNAEEHR